MNQKTTVFLVEIGFRKVADCPCVLTVAKCVQVFVAHFGAERRDKFSAFKAHLRRGTVLCFEIADGHAAVVFAAVGLPFCLFQAGQILCGGRRGG